MAQDLTLSFRPAVGVSEVVVNGYSVTGRIAGGRDVSENINPWVISGLNKIEFICEAFGEDVENCVIPEANLFLFGDASESLDILDTMKGDDNVQKRVEGLGAKLKVVFGIEFLLPDSIVGKWVNVLKPWRESKGHLPVSDIFKTYKNIEKAFLDRDLSQLVSFSRSRFEFASKVYQVSEKELEESFRMDCEEILQSDYSVRPQERVGEVLEVREISQNVVYQLRYEGGLPAIHTYADQNGFQQGFDITVADIKGAWTWIL